MDQNKRLIRKRYPDRSNVVNNEAEIHITGNEEELPYVKQIALEETVKNLQEQIVCLLCECNAKDKLMAEHAKTAQEANLGRERAEALVSIQKQELENVLQKKEAAIEKSINLNTALKNCRRELNSIKMEQNRDAMFKIAHTRLESKYIEAKKKFANLTVENARLTKALFKEETIKDVNNQISSLDPTERGNNVLKHKVKSRNADVANRQQLEIARQKLRMLVRKRVAGYPKTNPKNYSKTVDTRLSLIINRLSEENRILKENVCKRESEIVSLKAEIGRMRCDEDDNGNFVMNQMNDHFENLNLTNIDLDHQLSAAKVELKEAFHEISFLEMKLEDKSYRCKRLEATCLELQLQLTSKDMVTKDLEQQEKLLHNEMKITTDLTNNKLTHHSSLHDLITSEDGVEWEVVLKPQMIKEIINATETDEQYIVVPRALPVVPIKKRFKHTELVKKLLFRAKRGGNNKKLVDIATYKV